MSVVVPPDPQRFHTATGSSWSFFRYSYEASHKDRIVSCVAHLLGEPPINTLPSCWTSRVFAWNNGLSVRPGFLAGREADVSLHSEQTGTGQPLAHPASQRAAGARGQSQGMKPRANHSASRVSSPRHINPAGQGKWDGNNFRGSLEG